MNSAGSNWEKVDYFNDGREQKALRADFVFKNFSEALDFVNKVGELAEKQQHHPDINLGWGYVRIWLTTHSKHSISDKDFEIAKLIDSL